MAIEDTYPWQLKNLPPKKVTANAHSGIDRFATATTLTVVSTVKGDKKATERGKVSSHRCLVAL